MSTELATTTPPGNSVAQTSTRPIGVKLRGREKAAVLVIALGSEQAAEVLKPLKVFTDEELGCGATREVLE